MSQMIRFCLVFHNHQPVGNFDGVFEQAYQDSYLPFLNVLDRFPEIKFSLHTSGPLMQWLDRHHGEYVDRVAEKVAAGQIEIIGGAFYEPILTMIPPRDRVGQIASYSRWLESRLGAKVRGMWVPERVWEQSLTRDIVDAGIEYTVLDDFHFRNAGLDNDQLHGCYVTEEDGRVLRVFPGSERLRYLIPFGVPHETIDHLRYLGEQRPGAVAVFGDDGEKFGTWPDTKKHVYDDGWLNDFLEQLMDNRDWLNVTTLHETVENQPPIGKIYLPDGSYREMTEWVLPAELQVEYENLVHELEHDERWSRIQRFMRGGFWRNYRVKYPEANEMYSRMLSISDQIESAAQAGVDTRVIDQARDELYQGQCNCPYWHGAFGGIYLPHLRNAIYEHLIAAENILQKETQPEPHWVEADAQDFDFDARPELRLSSDKLCALIDPATGGQIYELDVRSTCHNLLATLSRRPEAYHRKVLAGANADQSDVASIHDRVVFKQEGLDQRLQYDKFPRKSLVDHFFAADTSLEMVARGETLERGDFAAQPYDATLRRGEGQVQALMSREATVEGVPLKITKGITMRAGQSALEVTYLLEGLPADQTFHFGVEWNFSGLPGGTDDRYFYRNESDRLGHLGSWLDLIDETNLGLTDEWLGMSVQLATDRPTRFWTFPIEAVSQSEGGFELIHQSVAVIPHWFVQADAEGKWTVTMTLDVDTSVAESRREQSIAAATC